MRRFGVPWESPAKKLRELILALRAIWDCWQNGTPLQVEGEFYNLSLMIPEFSPESQPYGNPPVYIAGVNPMMCRLAGEVADGFHVHPIHTIKYLKEVVIPHIETGAAKAGRRRNDVALSSLVFVITGATPQEMAVARECVRAQVAFYASTRNYRIILDTHGWGETAVRLNKKAAQGAWNTMAQEITDEMLEVFAVEGTPEAIPDKCQFGGGYCVRLLIPRQYGGGPLAVRSTCAQHHGNDLTTLVSSSYTTAMGLTWGGW